jgi:poly-gamma-glutamate capsule biosynthesis protein CapA/YwtB (metallophosphatase superfamily)
MKGWRDLTLQSTAGLDPGISSALMWGLTPVQQQKGVDKISDFCIMHLFMKRILTALSIIFFSCSCRGEETVYDSVDDSLLVIEQEETLFVTVAAVGDIMMGSDFPSPILPAENGKHVFAEVEEHLDADVVFGNLEGPLCEGGYTGKNTRSGRCYAFRTPPRFGSNLLAAGFNCMSLANNHARDFGPMGVNSTMGVLDSLGIEHSGPIGDIGSLTVNGMSVGLIAFSTYGSSYNILDESKAYEAIRSLSDSFDILIVSFHAGTEGTKALHTRNTFEYLYGEPRGNVIKFAHQAIDNGADLILGHGPHVPRGLELYKDRLIAYSLGNFVAYGRFSLQGATGKSLILRATLNEDGTFASGKIIPVDIKRPGIPHIDPGHYTTNLIRELSAEDFEEHAPLIDEEGNITRPEPHSEEASGTSNE